MKAHRKVLGPNACFEAASCGCQPLVQDRKYALAASRRATVSDPVSGTT